MIDTRIDFGISNIPWGPGFLKLLNNAVLPSLDGPILYVVSDYSGQQKGSNFFAVSILLIDIAASTRWEYHRRNIRSRIIRDSRRRAALKPLLSAANLIHGVLLSVLFEKAISHIFTDEVSLIKLTDALSLKARE